MTEKIIITTDGGSKTIENINPAVNNSTLAQFGEKIADLTTNTYQKTDRISKVNCDTEPGGGTKPTPTLTLDSDFTSIAALGAGGYKGYTTNSDGELYARVEMPAGSGDMGIGFAIRKADHRLYYEKIGSPTSIHFFIGVTETDNYKGVEVEYNLT